MPSAERTILSLLFFKCPLCHRKIYCWTETMESVSVEQLRSQRYRGYCYQCRREYTLEGSQSVHIRPNIIIEDVT